MLCSDVPVPWDCSPLLLVWISTLKDSSLIWLRCLILVESAVEKYLGEASSGGPCSWNLLLMEGSWCSSELWGLCYTVWQPCPCLGVPLANTGPLLNADLQTWLPSLMSGMSHCLGHYWLPEDMILTQVTVSSSHPDAGLLIFLGFISALRTYLVTTGWCPQPGYPP